MQTRPAWPLEPRMGFQALKCSALEEIGQELSAPPPPPPPCFLTFPPRLSASLFHLARLFILLNIYIHSNIIKLHHLLCCPRKLR